MYIGGLADAVDARMSAVFPVDAVNAGALSVLLSPSNVLRDLQTLRELLHADVIFIFQYSAAFTSDAFLDTQRTAFQASRDAGVLSVLKRRLVSLDSSLNHG